MLKFTKNIIKDDIKKKEGGFTIVEVMIVLAIAGLILAIVFIAVPALQRNSRNTQRRSDLANLRAQFETWTSNNNGKLPSDTDVNQMLSITGSTGWGHYNGNDDEPGVTVMDGSAIATLDIAPVLATVGETRPVGPANMLATNTAGEYAIFYSRDISATNLATIRLPNRQEIHIWGEMECTLEVLTNGNDKDTGIVAATGHLYTSADLEQSNARALAYVYQIEGEDNARCEDNA